ncbi:hypothetical protein DJ530_12830, partial [Sulfolobus sp. E1]
MLYRTFLIILFLTLIASTVPLYPHENFTYSVQIIDGDKLYLYTYNYTILNLNPLTYNLSIISTNGQTIFTKYYISYQNSQLFPTEFPIDGSQIHNLTFISASLKNDVNTSFYKGYVEIDNSSIEINLVYRDGVLYKINGSSNNIMLYVTLINSSSNSAIRTHVYDYLPLIVVLAVIIIAIIVL